MACEKHWVDRVFNPRAETGSLSSYRSCILTQGSLLPKAAIQYAIVSIAWKMQCCFMPNSCMSYNIDSTMRDVALDLIRVAMRRYFKRFEFPPLASELTRLSGYSKDLRSVFEYKSHRDGVPDPENAEGWLQSGSLVQNSEQVSAVQSRMMAIALVGVLLDVEGSRLHWQQIVLNARSLGWTLPQSATDIFEAMVQDIRWDARRWLFERSKSYSSASQWFCESFFS